MLNASDALCNEWKHKSHSAGDHEVNVIYECSVLDDNLDNYLFVIHLPCNTYKHKINKRLDKVKLYDRQRRNKD